MSELADRWPRPPRGSSVNVLNKIALILTYGDSLIETSYWVRIKEFSIEYFKVCMP